MIIDGLPLLGAPASGDEIPIERGTTTYKIDYDALAAAIISKLGGDPVTAEHGGTGLTVTPSMLINLASGSAASVFQANPRPGVTGVLPAANGGTGQTSLQAARNAMGLGDTTGALPVANGGTGAITVPGALSSLTSSMSYNGAWKNAMVGLSLWYYDTTSPSTYDVPSGSCIVLVIKNGSTNGVAMAIKYTGGASLFSLNRESGGSWLGWTTAFTN